VVHSSELSLKLLSIPLIVPARRSDSVDDTAAGGFRVLPMWYGLAGVWQERADHAAQYRRAFEAGYLGAATGNPVEGKVRTLMTAVPESEWYWAWMAVRRLVSSSDNNWPWWCDRKIAPPASMGHARAREDRRICFPVLGDPM
jgi:hypothetical protein